MIEDRRKPPQISILPSGFRDVKALSPSQRGYWDDRAGMSILSGMEKHDGKWWLHVSCACPNRMPTWEEFKEVKAIFIGRDKKAIQILPDEKNYVNIHPFCLHLFHAEEDGLPDFTHEGGL